MGGLRALVDLAGRLGRSRHFPRLSRVVEVGIPGILWQGRRVLSADTPGVRLAGTVDNSLVRMENARATKAGYACAQSEWCVVGRVFL